jgi:hypothetical protein
MGSLADDCPYAQILSSKGAYGIQASRRTPDPNPSRDQRADCGRWRPLPTPRRLRLGYGLDLTGTQTQGFGSAALGSSAGSRRAGQRRPRAAETGESAGAGGISQAASALTLGSRGSAARDAWRRRLKLIRLRVWNGNSKTRVLGAANPGLSWFVPGDSIRSIAIFPMRRAYGWRRPPRRAEGAGVSFRTPGGREGAKANRSAAGLVEWHQEWLPARRLPCARF